MGNSIKRALKRGFVKTHRKVFGKPKEVTVTTGRGGLTKTEIRDILDILGKAVQNNEVPNFTYEYRPPSPLLSSRAQLYLIPETVPVGTLRMQVNRVIRREYGVGYIIDGFGGGSAKAMEPRQTISRRTPRITPKTPRLRR